MRYLSLIFAFLFFISCKKDKTTSKAQQNTTANNPTNSLVVDSIPEKIGYEKVFNVIERSTTNTATTSVTQTISVFTCTFAIVSDTLLPNNIKGKKYKITDIVYPSSTYAYSYYGVNDSTWYFKTLNYNEHVHDFNLKLPLVANKTWTLNTYYGDNLTAVGQVSEPVNSINTLCYKVTGNCSSSTNMQYYSYAYFINNKGVIKHVYDITNFTNPSSVNVSEKELNMVSCNF